MRAVIQRVAHASVVVEGREVSAIGPGILLLLGIEESDGEEDLQWLARKVANLRIFNDAEGIMNLSVLDTGGDLLVVSQFTLHASTRKGNRPSYIRAAKPETAIPLYERFLSVIAGELGKEVGSGIFGADMKVSLLNDGPVTILVDTANRE